MSPKAAKWIFYIGTLISLVLFLGLTVDTHRQVKALTRADQLNEEVVAGKRVWHKYNCDDCHTILGFGGYYAPDMTKVYWRRGEEGIKAVVRTPEKFTTWRKMPRVAASEQELADLVTFLKWTREIDTNTWRDPLSLRLIFEKDAHRSFLGGGEVCENIYGDFRAGNATMWLGEALTATRVPSGRTKVDG